MVHNSFSVLFQFSASIKDIWIINAVLFCHVFNSTWYYVIVVVWNCLCPLNVQQSGVKCKSSEKIDMILLKMLIIDIVYIIHRFLGKGFTGPIHTGLYVALELQWVWQPCSRCFFLFIKWYSGKCHCSFLIFIRRPCSSFDSLTHFLSFIVIVVYYSVQSCFRDNITLYQLYYMTIIYMTILRQCFLLGHLLILRYYYFKTRDYMEYWTISLKQTKNIFKIYKVRIN